MKLINAKFIIALMSMLMVCVSCSEENEYDIFSTIEVTVVDADSRNPIEGADVSLLPTSYNGSTDADGKITFTELDEGQYKIQVQKLGYVTNRTTVSTISGGTVTQTITMKKQE